MDFKINPQQKYDKKLEARVNMQVDKKGSHENVSVPALSQFNIYEYIFILKTKRKMSYLFVTDHPQTEEAKATKEKQHATN